MQIIERRRYFHYDFYVNGVRIGKLRHNIIYCKVSYLYFLPNTYDERVTKLRVKKGGMVGDMLDEAVRILQKKMYRFAMNALEDIRSVEFEVDNKH